MPGKLLDWRRSAPRRREIVGAFLLAVSIGAIAALFTTWWAAQTTRCASFGRGGACEPLTENQSHRSREASLDDACVRLGRGGLVCSARTAASGPRTN